MKVFSIKYLIESESDIEEAISELKKAGFDWHQSVNQSKIACCIRKQFEKKNTIYIFGEGKTMFWQSYS